MQNFRALKVWQADYHLLLARDLRLLPLERYETLDQELQQVKRMLAKLIARVRRDGDKLKLTA